MKIKAIFKDIIMTIVIIVVISFAVNYIRKPDTINQLTNLYFPLIDGRITSLENNSKPIVLHFWATWCPTCKLEAPNLESIKDDAKLITIAVNSGKNTDLIKFMREKGYNYPVVNDNNGEFAKKFGIEVFPTTLIYNSDGELKFSEVGYSTTIGLKARLKLVE